MSKRQDWKLDPAEVTWGFYSSATSTRRKRRLSRELDSRAMEVKLVHVPTGIEVTGEVPKGHYSKKAMQQRRHELFGDLFAELENRVARHLRIPGR